MGDEAMLRGSVAALRRQGARRIAILCSTPAERWNLGDARVQHVFIPHLWEYDSTSAFLRLCMVAVRYPTFAFIGADCLDGVYGAQRELTRLEIARSSVRCARRVLIACFSFSRHPVPQVVEQIRSLPAAVQFRARDHLSHERFEVATGKPAVLTADVAFLLDADPASAQASAVGRLTASHRDLGRIVVGLNLNRLFLRLVPNGEASAVALVSRVAQLDDRLVFVLISHDSRSEDSDERLHDRLFEALPEALRDRVIRVSPLESAGAVKSLAMQLDFLVTQRMHLGIAALGCGVPVMCCEYQDKAEGMLAHFDRPDMVIRPEDFATSDRLADRIVAAVKDRMAFKAKINQALPRVIELAHGTFR